MSYGCCFGGRLGRASGPQRFVAVIPIQPDESGGQTGDILIVDCPLWAPRFEAEPWSGQSS
jgi:hypothetical protein